MVQLRRYPFELNFTLNVSKEPLGNKNTKISAYISGSKDPWIGIRSTVNPIIPRNKPHSTKGTLKFRKVNLRHNSQSFFLWEIMPSNKRVLNRLKHIVFRTIQEAETGLSFQNTGVLPSNLTILRVQPSKNIQKVEYDNSVESIPTLKIIGVLLEHPHHYPPHRHRRHHHKRSSLISRQSSWHRGQHYYDQRRSRNRNEPARDYPLPRKRTDGAMIDPRINEYIGPSARFHQDGLPRVSVPYSSAVAQPLNLPAGALPVESNAIKTANRPQAIAVPQYSQVIPAVTNGQPLPPQAVGLAPRPISSLSSGRRLSLSQTPSHKHYRTDISPRAHQSTSIDSGPSNPHHNPQNSEPEASHYKNRDSQKVNNNSNHENHHGVRETLSHIKDKLMHPVPPTSSAGPIA
ncbi:predicted protein [Sclerotinia sclerotiorum 1980 UF-70]|uniref:Uncharacterized protein n=1 Tax=Sclerotinia sclerotiorum (strain ATCC 18683 / 1980 / Ss-1) TaxID=665079 RepID=A7EW01_SCLS1|nr:predicted protein [Sclerotinia sclerotiorum 1980 UF-70]EDN93643.1 predicted protein [Sclerotinia sclerotiorum 1980 UF-70]